MPRTTIVLQTQREPTVDETVAALDALMDAADRGGATALSVVAILPSDGAAASTLVHRDADEDDYAVVEA